MKTLILLRGMGVNGKSTIVNDILRELPSTIHLPQTNRQYFSQFPKEMRDGTRGITKFYLDALHNVDFVDGIYVTERTPLDYLLNFEMRRKSKGEKSEDYLMEDGRSLLDTITNEEVAFLSKFNKIIYIRLATYDLPFLKKYLDIPGFHQDYYKTRGRYISLQDRWMDSHNDNLSIVLNAVRLPEEPETLENHHMPVMYYYQLDLNHIEDNSQALAIIKSVL